MATFAGVIVRRLSNFTNVYNRMETTNKKIRGSAFVDDEGLFVFTPWTTRGSSFSPLMPRSTPKNGR